MMSWSRLKTMALVTVVGAAVLVPLYGDPRQAPVTHAEWARMLLRALEMGDVLQASTQASQVFSTLSWKNSLAFGAEQYLKADGVEVGERGVVAAEGVGEVVYPLAVVRGGDYRLRLRVKGNPATPASVEITRKGETAPAATFTIVPSSLAGWVDGGTSHLDPAAYTATVLLPPGTSLEKIEVAPPCVTPIEPPGGWKPTAVVESGDLAVTAVKAMDKESELPPAGLPIDVSGSHFQPTTPAATPARAVAGGGLEGLWLKAGPLGVQAVVFVVVPETGLYTLSTFGIQGGGQRWLGDSCRKAVVCGSTQAQAAASGEPAWQALMTTELTAGRHFFTVNLAPGAAVERLRLERKKDSPADYAATLKRLGFDAGPEGPVGRGKAVDAMKFIQGNRSELISTTCGDVVPEAVLAAEGGRAGGPGDGGLAEPPGPVPGPPAAPPNPGTGPPPLAPPALPPQQPASPVIP